MPIAFPTRLKRAWNVFTNKDPTGYSSSNRQYIGQSFSVRPDRIRLSRGNERSIVTAIYNRIAMDVATLKFNHVDLDENKRFKEVHDSGLNTCLSLEANIDQTSRAFIQDTVVSMLDEGVVALAPVETDKDIKFCQRGTFDIYSMRVAKVVDWYPKHVKLRIYNDNTGDKEDIIYSKEHVAIIENPFYAVMNENNSTLQRLIRKLNLMDVVDEKNSSAKLDLLIQLPYVVKTEHQRNQAEKRRTQVEEQLAESKYGIAYVDGTERITQLNRPVESNILKHVEYLTNMLYGQLGISQNVMNGTADEKENLNYNNRTVEPIASAITDELTRKFLTKTARTQGQSVMFFKDAFRLVPVENIAEIADKFTRNEIMSSNEIRQIVGLKPSPDPKADELRNANISEPKTEAASTEAIDPLKLPEQSVSDSRVSLETPISELG